MNNIYSLKKAGFKVYVRHFRFSNVDGQLHSLPECKEMAKGAPENIKLNHIKSRGGKVEIEIQTPDGNHKATATALCCDKDNYNKKIGIRIALGRARNEIEKLVTLTPKIN